MMPVYSDGNRANHAVANLSWIPRKDPEAITRRREADKKRQMAKRQADPEKARQSSRDRYQRTKKEYNPRLRTIRNARYASDPQYKLSLRLRGRLVNALKRGTRNASAVNDLGCTLDEFRLHIERQFTKKMTWENWGRGAGKWHLDHIRPISGFDLSDPEQLRQALHFTNYRPLWSEANIAKHNRRELLL